MSGHTSKVWLTENGFALLCDCGTTIRLHVTYRGPDGTHLPPPQGRVVLPEQAVTCDCCGSVHWLTFGPDGVARAP